MAVPDWQALMLPALRAMADGAVWTNRNVYERVAKDLRLSEADLNELLPSETESRFQNRASWALFDMTQAGLLESVGRGQRRITKRGLDMLQEKPSAINRSTLRRFSEYEQYLSRSRTGKNSKESDNGPIGVDVSTQKTPDEVLQDVFKAVQQPKRSEILQTVLGKSPKWFEHLVLDVLRAAGYGGGAEDRFKHLGKTADGGVDGVISEDALGLGRIYVQAKRYAINNVVDVESVRAFAGSLDEYGSKKGVFISTSSFTRNAEDFIKKVGDKKIALIDGESLVDLMLKYNVGVRTIRAYELKGVDLDYFSDGDE